MYVRESDIEVRVTLSQGNILNQISDQIQDRLPGDDSIPIRFVINESFRDRYQCEIAFLEGFNVVNRPDVESIFAFRKRTSGNTDKFTAVLVVPTGVGAEIGGHAGDATPVATLMSSICDRLITHPNVLNGSDLIELPKNTLYVEGSALSRLLMGTIGLQSVRSNRVLVVIDEHQDQFFVEAAVNAVNAARSSWGLICPMVLKLDPPLHMESRYSSSGRVTGAIDGIGGLTQHLEQLRSQYDAVAISSVISVPLSYHIDYFESEGQMLNPWGGVEAMLTHTISALFDTPSAHAPMLENQEISNMETGIVDPRMAAEAISLTFMQSVLRGLQRSPKIIVDPNAHTLNGTLTAEDVSCLVIPDNCLGLPTLAALEQNIPVIAVKENKTVMKNDLDQLPWNPGQLHYAENYWEAAGIMACLKVGVDPTSLRRPLKQVLVDTSANLNVLNRENLSSVPHAADN